MEKLLDDALDALFDIQFFECDPLTPGDQDTPLHLAVRYASERDPELGSEMIQMMCDAGCDPRIRNKHGQKPADIVYGSKASTIKSELGKAEYILTEGVQDEGEREGEEAGSGSESD